MKKLVKIAFFPLFLTLLLFSCNKKEDSKAANYKDFGSEQKDLVIFSTNDVNGAYNKYLGYDGLKKYMNQMRQGNDYILLVDTGNFSSGNETLELSKGKSSIELMNACGYDLLVPGTHEFDYGIDSFKENMKLFKGKVLCCNLIDINTKKLMFDPYCIYKFGDQKIAFLGVTSPDTLFLHEAKGTFFKDNKQQIYFFEDETGKALYDQVQFYVDDARENGADKVVLLSHLGNRNVSDKWSSTQLIINTNGIDCVIDGHTGEIIDGGMMANKNGLMIPIVEAGDELKYIGIMNITSDGYCFSGITSQTTVHEYDEEIGNLIKELNEKYK